jgi:hypothetical protein
MLERLRPETLTQLYRIAKVPGKGLTPFFTSPHNMIQLRNAVERLEKPHTGENHDLQDQKSRR